MKKIILALFISIIFIGCSTQKNSFKNRQYHKLTSWFNGIFNGEDLLETQKKELKKAYEENYSKILPIGLEYYAVLDTVNKPYNSIANSGNNNDVVIPSGFDAIEAKATKVIEKHSMKIGNREENSMIGRAYLLVGKSLFYQKKYFDALDPLNYVTKNFKNSKSAQEANIYKTISEIHGGNYFEGIDALKKLYESDPYKNKELKVMIARSYAQLLIDQKKYEEALEPLEKAEYFSHNKSERVRLFYVMGQVFSKLGKQKEAGEAFTKVFKMNPGYDLEIKSQLAISANFDPEINNYSNYKNHLLDISKKGIYSSKKNELYYGISEMAFRANKLDEAIKYAQLSLKEPMSDPYIRGKSYENFGDIKFKQNNYVYASAYYDSAQTIYKTKTDQDRIKLRNDGLKKLMEKHYLVKKNDSILKLSLLSKEEQIKYFKNFIEDFKKKEEKQIEKEKRQMESFQLETKVVSFSNSFNNTDKGKFYFYNQGLKSSGINEFKRVWGEISLKDNWRNSNAINTVIEDKQAELTGQISVGNPRRFEVEYYLEQIPTSKTDLDNLKIERDTTQLSLGIGYFNIFNNRELAGKELNELVSSPPKSDEIKLKAIYQLYRIYKNDDKELEEKYKDEILKNYPNTIYAGYILNPEVEFITPETKEALDAYKIAYELYKEGKYDEVKIKVNDAIGKYSTEIIIAKFALLNAYAIKQTEGEEKFKQNLEIVATAYEDTDEGKKAKKLLESLEKRKAVKEENQVQEQIQNQNQVQEQNQNQVQEQNQNQNHNQNQDFEQ